jgi:hypothetical protein
MNSVTQNPDNPNEFVIIWDAPKIVPPEFRLYYDDAGRVLFYTCEKPEGNFIVIDALTYAQSRPDVRVIDGKISTVQSHAVVCKLMPADEGQACAFEDISIIASDDLDKVTKWKLMSYEL